MSWREIMGVAPTASAEPGKHTQNAQNSSAPTPTGPGEHTQNPQKSPRVVGEAEKSAIEGIARLDAERNERDRIAGRGYDNEPTAQSPEHVFEQRQDREHWQQSKIDLEVEAEIRCIEDQAFALGWPRERLWNSGFWHPWPRGLAAVMDAGDRIVEVTADYIVIERPRPTAAPLRLPFWRKIG